MVADYPLTSEATELPAPDTMAPTQRRCLASGEIKDKSLLIRFVIGPDNQIVPDIAGRLPGRGLWVQASREILNQAVAKKAFARAAKRQVHVPADLVLTTANLLSHNCLNLLGLARSAGILVLGQRQVEQALSESRLSCILMAQDAGQDCLKKLARGHIVPSPWTKEQIGDALGQSPLASVGLLPHALSTKLMRELVRWRGVSDTGSLDLEPSLDCRAI
ncbi:MAG: DUF448 domain-containing protein [Proteobacteria bacterium]|jgi:predicted RNA-binding protein YlxR (DUF448 family)|nr:DUF448 domain-containing protein [Alphaproteobacteria bacterium]NCC02944.1 DUF448 domain-containing protein [Pseudomonadota bacterium]